MHTDNQIIKSMLDQDIYKLSLGQVVFNHFPCAKARYQFINRGKTKFPATFGDRLRYKIQMMTPLRMHPEETAWLHNIRYLKPTYIDWLSGYIYNPDEVKISQIGNDLEVFIEGPWYRSLMWEVPLLATISELYYTMLHEEDSQRYNHDFDHTWQKRARKKAEQLQEAKCQWAEFGTRRR